jgi:two-component system catabolic regulation response regulator CreB
MMSKPKILIIEDEPSIADNIVFALEREGYKPFWKTTAGEGENALVEESGIALVILDIGLPDGNGFDVCRRIRSTSEVPIIFLTARDQEVDRIVGLELGADDYVAKPFSPRELAARCRAVLRRTNKRHGTTAKADAPGDPCESNGIPFLKKGFFEHDPEGCRFLYCQRPLPLSPNEYRILRRMFEHPGRVYSRRQIMESAWDEPDASMERTVDTHIKTLRTKLLSIRPGIQPVQTHRGFGYSLQIDGK